MNKMRIVGFILAASLLASLPVLAQEKHGKGKQRQNQQRGRESDRDGDRDRDQERKAEGRQGFTRDERDRIQLYCERYGSQEGKHRRSLPPGLAKKVARGGKLPPGWMDKCVPGQVMPAEVYRECRPLPPELTVKLPVPPVGTVTVAIDGRVVRILEATREILDVFDVHVRF